MVLLRVSPIALFFVPILSGAALAQQAPEQVRIQVVQNRQVGSRIIATEIGNPVSGTAAELGINVTPVTVANGESLDKVLLRSGIQPDLYSRRIVLGLNPALSSPQAIPTGITIQVPSADAYFERWEGERDLGTKVRLREDRLATKEIVWEKISASETAADVLMQQAGNDRAFVKSLQEMKTAGAQLKRVNADVILLSDKEQKAIDLAISLLDPSNRAEIPRALLPLIRQEAAVVAKGQYNVATARMMSSSAVNFNVLVRTCSTASCASRWNPDKDCQGNQDRCGLKVCYLGSGDFLEQQKAHAKSAQAAARFVPECKPFPTVSSPADRTLGDAHYFVWAVSLPDMVRVSCAGSVEVSQVQAKKGTVYTEFGAEINPSVIGSGSCF